MIITRHVTRMATSTATLRPLVVELVREPGMDVVVERDELELELELELVVAEVVAVIAAACSPRQ